MMTKANDLENPVYDTEIEVERGGQAHPITSDTPEDNIRNENTVDKLPSWPLLPLGRIVPPINLQMGT
jgi:hypothetical protein